MMKGKDLRAGKQRTCRFPEAFNVVDVGLFTGFTVTVRNIRVSAGAGFLVALTGDIMTMPGLPKVPAAEKIDVDENGVITGLF